jgi:hypothetical protein
MSNLRKLGTILMILVVFQLSCTKLEQKPAKEGALPIISLNQTNSIPSDWGKLISTTISPDSPRLVLLWFQDEKGDIHLASYDMRQNKLSPDAAVIRRY